MKHTDLLGAAAVVLIVCMLIIPLPPFLLDLFITLNIAAALAILVSTLYMKKALELSSFPSLLLLTTMFRLAINVSVTRLILLEGDAGHLVEAFGKFVVGGNVVVGLVIFLILIVIQFVVVTNGAGRVAEVAARFTLDAMPGKQMAIDADLNAGQITDEQAKQRREEIAEEADFYGAMDGASKFVKGDAMAGILIVLINLIGGIVIGVLQQGMPFGEAASHFSLLTVGDGLCAQIPALLISVATGIIVTRSASDDDLGTDTAKQVLLEQARPDGRGRRADRAGRRAGPAEDPVHPDGPACSWPIGWKLDEHLPEGATELALAGAGGAALPRAVPAARPGRARAAARPGRRGAPDRPARAGDRLRPRAARRPVGRRLAALARHRHPPPDRLRARHGHPVGAHPRRGRPGLARVRRQGARRGDRRRAGSWPATSSRSTRATPSARCPASRRPSPRSASRRPGSPTRSAPRPRRSATPSSTASR